MGKIVISHRNLTPWPDRIFTKINFIYTNQFLSVIQEPTQLARKICEKKLKSPHPSAHGYTGPMGGGGVGWSINQFQIR